jgi:glycosyltransferase involved in cell wall biosynthesis
MLSAVLLTLGDPARLTGGYLFHRRLATLAPARGASLEFVSFVDRPFPLAMLDAPRVLRRIRGLHPDVVVLDSIAAAFAGPALAVRTVPEAWVAMAHQPPGGIDSVPPRSTLQAWLDRLAYGRMRRLLVASDSIADDFRQRWRNVYVVPPGRDVAASAGPRPDDLRRGRRIALMSVGNWVERKGILSLLEAVALLPKDAATLHLVGDTAAEPRYARKIWQRLTATDLRDRVIVHGPVSVEEVAAMYAASDVFVLPSLKEPYGTVYGEAMAFGLPVVGWRAGNLPYLATHDREGLIAEPGDIAGLSHSLARLTEDQDLRHRLGAAAYSRALQRPTWDDVATMFFDHLRAVAGGA